LAPGGVLLYATCSIFDAENGAQVEAFLRRHPDASRLPLSLPPGFAAVDGQLLPSGPGAEHNHDGFFYALLQKK
jgi:16S rRNA (cytosine967-C5)-methyltransferase